MAQYRVEFEPHGGLSFRDARPFDAGESRVAIALPFPPPPTAFAAALAEVRDGVWGDTRAPGKGSRNLTTRGLAVVVDNRECFAAPMDLVTVSATVARRGKRWSLLQPLAIGNTLGTHTELRLACPWRSERGAAGLPGQLLGGGDWSTYLLQGRAPIDPIPADSVFKAQVRSGTKLKDDRLVEEGMLYTQSILFLDTKRDVRFRLSASSDTLPVGAHIVPLGGEGRPTTMTIGPTDSASEVFTDELRAQCLDLCKRQVPTRSPFEVMLKLVLLTPAVFSASLSGAREPRKGWHPPPAWRPFWMKDSPSEMPWLPSGTTLALQSAIVGRPSPLGFWDSTPRDRADDSTKRTLAGPKPMHRAAPAGSVYFLRLAANSEPLLATAIERMFELFWFRTLLLDKDAHKGPQVKSFFGRTGFGTVVIGATNV